MYREYQKTGKTIYFRYAPMLMYDLKRNWDEKTVSEKEAKSWAYDLAKPNSDEMKGLYFICQYVTRAIRRSNEDQ